MDEKSAVKMNGSADPKVADGQAIKSFPSIKSRQRRKPSTVAAWTQTLLRLCLWYSVFVVAFRCPSSSQDLTDASPTLCSPYLQLKAKLSPYVEPSYKQYLHPYVEKAQPYADTLNAKVYAPAASVASTYYDTYAAAHVDRASSEFSNQWAINVEPKVEAGKAWAVDKYQSQVSPHITRVTEIVDPHVKHVQGQLVEMYDTTVIPFYEKTSPHVQRLYLQGQYASQQVILPYLQAGQKTVSGFIARRIWPRLVILYGENVEPQILRIMERLARYKDSRKLAASVVKMEAESSITSAAAKASSLASSATVAGTSGESVISSDSLPAINISAEQNETEIREKIESDLETWQTKFAKAAEKGAEDLGERVNEITSRQIKVQAHGVGKALVTELDQSVQSSFKNLKQHISTSITKISDDASFEEEDVVYDDLLFQIKNAGEGIRKKAVAVRTWKQNYDNETSTLVHAALDSTLDVIDNIRDLGLQEIGMRWAWMEGVTYKDWSKYTTLKKTFDTWRDEVEAVALKHKGFVTAKEEGDAVQDHAMEMAENAAKELKRLKDVAKWKVWSHDTTDDFSSRITPERVMRSTKIAVSKAMDDAAGVVSDIVTDATSAAQSASSSAAGSIKSVINSESAAPKKVWGGAMAEPVVGPTDTSAEEYFEYWTDQVESMLGAAGDKVSDLTSVLSEAMLKPTSSPGTVEVITSLAGEQYAKALSAASEALFGTPQPMTESIASVASDRYAQAVTAASYAIYGTPTPVLESLASKASLHANGAATQVQAAYASITAMASLRLAEGLSAAAEQYTSAKIAIGAQPPPLHQQYMSAAQRQYYEGLGLAHDQYSRFVSAASTAVYGAPTPVWKEYADQASQKILGTPKPAYEESISALKDQYESAFAVARENLGRLSSSVSEIVAETANPGAESMYAKAMSSYSAVTAKASAMIAKASKDASEAYYGSSTGVAESVASKVSEGIYGTEASWSEAMASAAYDNYDALVSRASLQIYGTPTPLVESAWSQAGEYAAQATAAAAAQYKVLEGLVAELIVGKEPVFTESVMSKLSAAYYTGWASAASVASEGYASASSMASEGYASASSVADEGYASVTSVAGNAYDAASSVASQAADSVSSVASVASKVVTGEKDEL